MNPAVQEALDAAVAQARLAADNAGFAASDIARAHQSGDTSRLRQAFELTKAASEAADNAVTRLLTVGAARPSSSPVARDSLRLEQLDTPAARRLLAALEEAAKAGEELDKERGWVDTEGGAIGHGETLAGMAIQLRTEIFGPSGSGQE